MTLRRTPALVALILAAVLAGIVLAGVAAPPASAAVGTIGHAQAGSAADPGPAPVQPDTGETIASLMLKIPVARVGSLGEGAVPPPVDAIVVMAGMGALGLLVLAVPLTGALRRRPRAV